MLPPVTMRWITYFQRRKLSGHLTVRFHEGTVTRVEPCPVLRPDDDCTCTLAAGAVPCPACEQDHRWQARTQAGRRSPG